MGARVLVTADADADPERVRRDLEALGGVSVQPPAPELPDVYVVTLTDESADGRRWADTARRVSGVRTAEPDVLRWDLDGPAPGVPEFRGGLAGEGAVGTGDTPDEPV